MTLAGLVKNLQIMLKNLHDQPPLDLFKAVLSRFIHPYHELCHFPGSIDLDYFEREFASLHEIL